MTNLIDLIGRVLISLVFLLSGYNKIFNYSGTVVWMEGFGVPGFLLGPTKSGNGNKLNQLTEYAAAEEPSHPLIGKIKMSA